LLCQVAVATSIIICETNPVLDHVILATNILKKGAAVDASIFVPSKFEEVFGLEVILSFDGCQRPNDTELIIVYALTISFTY
jgi:hypothetical protein